MEDLNKCLEFTGKKGDRVVLKKIGIKPGKENKTKAKVGKRLEITLFVPVRVGSTVKRTRILDDFNIEPIEKGVGVTKKIQSILQNEDGTFLIETTSSFYKMKKIN